MGEIEFVKKSMSINTRFKLENKKNLNGSFKNRDRSIERKSRRKVRE